MANSTQPADAARFLQLLDPAAIKFEFRTFDDNKARKDKKLTRTFYGTLAAHTAKLQRLNNDGAGVFVVINETDGIGRENENIVRVRAVFADLDGAPLEPVQAAKVKPHIIVETSPGKWHCYWRVDDMPLADFTPVQEALSETFNSCSGVKGLAGVLRLPGFYHRKADDPFLVHIDTALDDTPPYPATYFKLAERPPHQPVDDEIEVNPDKAIAALDAMSNDDVDEETWYRLMVAAYVAAGDNEDDKNEVYAAFVRWSKRSIKHNDQRTRDRWRDFRRKPPRAIRPGTKPLRVVTPGTLYAHADATAPGWREAMLENALAALKEDYAAAVAATAKGARDA